MRNWDLLLPHAKFAYNNYVNKSTSKSPFEIIHGYKPRTLVDLIPLLSHAQVSMSTESYAQHIKRLHKKISKKIQMSSEVYKHMAESHKGQRNLMKETS